MSYMSGIAGMLARGGQQTGAQIGNALAGIGANVGGLLSQRQRYKEGEERAGEVQALLQENADNPAKLNALGREYETRGDERSAQVFYDAAKEATAKATKKTEATAGRGKGELMALANNPKFDVTNPKMQTAFFGMADAYGVSREDAMAIALDVKNKRDGGNVTSSRGGGTWKDKNNNYYELGIVRTETGEQKQWIPINPDAPKTPSGELTPVGGAYTESAGEKMGRDIDTTRGQEEAKGYAELRMEAIDSLPQIEAAIYSAEKSLEILDDIDTGGFSTAVVRAATDFLGVTPADEADFNLRAGQQILRGLNAFEGAISEGEREFLASLYQRLERSKGANRAILLTMIDESRRLLRDAKARADNRTEKEYLDNRESYDAPLKKPNKKVSWSELQRGP